jgi:predicted Zn-dependent peptidase
MQILDQFERAEDRLERIAKHYVRHGKDLDLLGKIDAVTVDQVKQFAANMFKSPVTYAVVGGDTHGVPSADKLTSQYFK